MAGTEELHSQKTEDSFQWDEQSQLYYHASSGFYHDPAAGWYYSTKDGLYYKFENGSYVPWETDQADESNANKSIVTVGDNSVPDQSYQHAPRNTDTNEVKLEDGEFVEEATPNESTVDTDSLTNGLPENLPPPSEWLEDTLIELYLSGYSNKTIDNASGASVLDDDTCLNKTPAADGVDNDDDDAYELEEGEWVPDDTHEVVVDRNGVEDPFGDEEMWRAQYGQTIQSNKEELVLPGFPVVDLWDWSMVKSTKKKRKRSSISICRLVGRLIKKSSKLHPSMPSSGPPLLKTAPICEAQLDLVRVKSGRVYKLRSPKLAYLATLSFYDSLNPTKDWGFPELSTTILEETNTKWSKQHIEPNKKAEDKIGLLKESCSSEKHSKGAAYRDRAAERRSLHGGFGVGPGQKKSESADDDDVDFDSSSHEFGEEAAAAEALEKSFGVGSYARRILENMGWKEGEALGSSMKGLTEPIQAVGNRGSSGLGWNHNMTNYWKHN